MAKAGADVRNLAELEMLDLRLGQFMPDIASVHESVEAELSQVIVLLDQHRTRWLGRSQALRHQLDQARVSQANSSRRNGPSNQGQVDALQRQVIQADKQLQLIVVREKQLNELVARYRAQASQLILRGNDLVPRARHFLRKAVKHLHAYQRSDVFDEVTVPSLKAVLWRQSCAAMLRVAGGIEVPGEAVVVVCAYGLSGAQPDADERTRRYLHRLRVRFTAPPGDNRPRYALLPADHIEPVRERWLQAGGEVRNVVSLGLTSEEVAELVQLYRAHAHLAEGKDRADSCA